MPISPWLVAVGLVAAALGACTLSSQQLLLPAPPIEAHGARKQPGGAPLARISRKRWGAEAVGTDKLTGKPSPRRHVVANEDGVSLSIVEASIQEAAKSILGDVLGVTYTVSDQVKGTISIHTAKPVPKAALLEIFEDALRGAGAAIAVKHDTYRIVPSAEAVASAPLRGGGRSYRRLPGMGIHVVPLKYVAATEMERILKAIAPNANLLRTDKDRNLLVVAGTRSDLDALMDAVDVFDIDWMRGMSFGIYPLESADPEAVAKELDTVFANDRDSPSQGIVRFIPNQRLKSVLVISSRAEYLRRARAWIQRLDTATQATVKQVFVYPVRSRTAAELASLLRRIYGQEETTTAPRAPVEPLSPIETSTSLSSPRGSPAGGRAPAATTAPATTAPAASESAAKSEPSPASTPGASPRPSGGPRDDRLAGISVIEDEANNTLVITATALEYRRVRQILERLDVAPNQVLLEATIAEVRLNDRLQMGVRWFFKSGNNDLTFTDLVSESAGNVVGAPFAGFSNFFNTSNIQVFFKALSSVTDVNIISSPTLMVMDNKKATLQVGDEVPVVTQSAVGVATGDAPIVNSVSYRNTGIVLNVTPRIGDRGRILLDIEQEASDVVATDSSDIESPTIQQRRIKTTVAVNDGEGLILGGLIQDHSTNARGQIPLLGKLPLLGNLFKDKDDEIERTELLVAITPRIVRDREQIRGITEEFRSRIHLSTRPQRERPPDTREQVDRLIR